MSQRAFASSTMAGERLLGHPGIVLERERLNGRIVVDVADGADEHGDGADARSPTAQRRKLARDIEVGRSGRGPSSRDCPLIRR